MGFYIVLAIVGNKIDLIKDREEVPYKEAVEYAKELGAIFKYTSAKENKGINVLHNQLRNYLQPSLKSYKIWSRKNRNIPLARNSKRSQRKRNKVVGAVDNPISNHIFIIFG